MAILPNTNRAPPLISSNLVRQTRTSQLESVDPQSTDAVYLGRPDKDFEFGQLSQKVQLVACSAKEPQIDDVVAFLDSL